MALNRPFGVAPYQHGTMASTSMRVTKYRIPSGDGSAFYVNDTVIAAAGADANGIPNIAKATGTARIRGVIVGFEIPATNLPSLQGTVINDNVMSVPAAKGGVDYYAFVVDNREATFMCQDDGITTGNLVAASANLNCNLTIAAPSQPQQVSATVILSSSIAVTSTFSMKLLGLAQLPAIPGGGSNVFGAYAVWAMRANLHEFDGSVAGV